MSLHVYLDKVMPSNVYCGNVTHNLGAMAEAAGIYQALWRPEDIGITTAAQLIEPLRAALAAMRANPDRFTPHNPPNGWGTYEGFVNFVAEYLARCEAHPDATVSVSR